MGLMKYKKVSDGQWVRPKRRFYYMKCCNCGLVHKFEFKLFGTIKRRVIQFRAMRIK